MRPRIRHIWPGRVRRRADDWLAAADEGSSRRRSVAGRGSAACFHPSTSWAAGPTTPTHCPKMSKSRPPHPAGLSRPVRRCPQSLTSAFQNVGDFTEYRILTRPSNCCQAAHSESRSFGFPRRARRARRPLGWHRWGGCAAVPDRAACCLIPHPAVVFLESWMSRAVPQQLLRFVKRPIWIDVGPLTRFSALWSVPADETPPQAINCL